jgi:hypothetical protein
MALHDSSRPRRTAQTRFWNLTSEMPGKLTLEWSYTPADFFETQIDYTEPDYAVHIADGRVAHLS